MDEKFSPSMKVVANPSKRMVLEWGSPIEAAATRKHPEGNDRKGLVVHLGRR